MAFFESPRFPENIAFGAVGGPEWSTSVVVTAGGREQRNAAWAYPRHRWDVSAGVKTQADFELLRAHFMTVRGRLHGFRFKDWADFRVTYADGIMIALSATTFQLAKRYTSGAQTMQRQIRKPVGATVQVRDGTTPLVVGIDYTLDATTGVVTTTNSRDAQTLNWSGEFDVPMRYDTDRIEARIVARKADGTLLHEWSSIQIVELPA